MEQVPASVDAKLQPVPGLREWPAAAPAAAAAALAEPDSTAAATAAAAQVAVAAAALEPGAPATVLAASGQSRAGEPPVRHLHTPWEPLLTRDEVRRGLAYYGSGRRMQRVAAKLLAGRPIKVFTLGGSVTKGSGSSSPAGSYASRLFQLINSTFPHSGHTFVNKGVGATSSGIFTACVEKMVEPEVDLVVLEFSINEHPEAPYTDRQRMGYEQLIRKLLRMPGRPALIQLHYYAWWRSEGDGVEQGLFYFPQAEAQLTVFSQYYDVPSVSMRSAIYPLMQAGVDKLTGLNGKQINNKAPSGYEIPFAEGAEKQFYLYADRTHPNDQGHQVIAELLGSVLAKAVDEEQGDNCQFSGGWADSHAAPRLRGLPPPMIPGNADVPTSLCAMQEDFKELAVASAGFEYKPERPQEETFVGQKWGWTSQEPGAMVELLFDSRSDDAVNATRFKRSDPWASVYLSHLKSYEGMGTAQVACVSGCQCKKTVLDGTWEQQATLMQIHRFPVTQHAQCRVRVTVRKQGGAVKQAGHKVTLMALMVSHYPLRLDQNDKQAEQVAEKFGT
ncbi:hypothetical protein CHLNCDRAFT_134328 [Chlorella variabilis]|uniref:SGNH hydrolase-type esterase domain-containing protein n=1 Tax=Chlorella variabilis TaxID=554065 RepID=E1ZFS5_CHLVA|nr:hypothetical protein CHLNCDRAFT_134328 [Chlorella variabilis]EFN55332.1 hypothetical protein CHLNCDRAFT_134328 [Chlorella variabilis]|eukprot:XP_005847434.1 hypothetical protein CHLNCDRAFT_134328 [Chlorella variabilis]